MAASAKESGPRCSPAWRRTRAPRRSRTCAPRTVASSLTPYSLNATLLNPHPTKPSRDRYAALGFLLAPSPVNAVLDGAVSSDAHAPTLAAASLVAYLRARVPSPASCATAAPGLAKASGDGGGGGGGDGGGGGGGGTRKRRRCGEAESLGGVKKEASVKSDGALGLGGRGGGAALAALEAAAAAAAARNGEEEEEEEEEDGEEVEDEDEDENEDEDEAAMVGSDPRRIRCATSSRISRYPVLDPSELFMHFHNLPSPRFLITTTWSSLTTLPRHDLTCGRCDSVAAARAARRDLGARLRAAAEALLPDAAFARPLHIDSIEARADSGVKRDACVARDSPAAAATPMPRSKAASVTLFLNRLLGLALDDQVRHS